MDWIQLAVVVLSNVGLFIWARTEANQDRREISARMDIALKIIADEMRDFHGRLCAIEERRK